MRPLPATRTAPDRSLIEGFRSCRALVIGEGMLDVYLWGSVARLSPEGPFPVLNAVTEECSPGGAANAAANLAALGADVTLMSVVGDDEAGETLVDLTRTAGVDPSGVVVAKHRRTLVKRRVVADGRTIARLDDGDTGGVDTVTAAELAHRVKQAMDACDLILVSDYRYGVVSEPVMAALRGNRRPLKLVDSKQPQRYRRLRPDAMTPNYSEVMALIQEPPLFGRERVDQIESLASLILRASGAASLFVTLDADGVVVVDCGGEVVHLPAVAHGQEVCGAGDTFSAALGLALAGGADNREAARLAGRASAVVMNKPGTAVCSYEELRGAAVPKVHADLDDLVATVARKRDQGRSVVFTNGCFDVLHAGHVACLQEAAQLGDVLVVGVNTDDSVARLKGADRPVNPLADRLAVLSGLTTVDHLVAFAEDTPRVVLERLRPDVYCKGGDYAGHHVPEKDLVESWGGRFVLTTHLEDRSTSRTVARIQGGSVLKVAT